MKNEEEDKFFVLEITEVHKQNFRVRAQTQEEAIKKLKDASMWEDDELGVYLYGELEYSHTLEGIAVYDYK